MRESSQVALFPQPNPMCQPAARYWMSDEATSWGTCIESLEALGIDHCYYFQPTSQRYWCHPCDSLITKGQHKD